MRGLDGKAAIVAGAGGIGDAVALRLVHEGCDVMLADVSADAAEAGAARAAAEGTARCLPFTYDQSDDGSVAALVAAAHAAFGRVDFLHANAADTRALRADGDAETIELGVFDATIAVNLRGAFLCTRHAIPHIAKQGGAIVYTSSGAAYAGEPERIAYAMTKAALGALARHVARRWGKDRVRANTVAPGTVMTPTLKSIVPAEQREAMLAASPGHRLGEPEDIAAMVAMLFSDDGEWITGQAISVDGGSTMRP